MSFDERNENAFELNQGMFFDGLNEMSSTGAPSPMPNAGPRARRRAKRLNVSRIGMLAPLLAAEGCLSLGKKNIDLGNKDSNTASDAPASAALAGDAGGTPFAPV